MKRPVLIPLCLCAGLSACLPDLDKQDTAAPDCDGPEVCNGLDDDCDGSVDENATDALAWYPDTDGDGYGDPSTSTLSCEQPSGYVDEEDATDCDDDDDRSHPGADEIWYDGADQDCSGGSDFDKDGDGFDSSDHDGEDCDDDDEAVNPEATEVWYDGTDQDCSGGSDYDQDGDGQDSDAHGGDDCDDTDEDIHLGAEEIWYDGVDSDCGMDSDYDQDGDGFDHGSFGGDDCDDLADHIHPTAFEWIDGEDNNCDGDLDALSLGDAPVLLRGEVNGDAAGCALAALGDVNGDGYDDIAVGAYGNDGVELDSGATYILHGPISSGSLGSADGIIRGDVMGSYSGSSIANAGDVSGDGINDLVIGAPWEGTMTTKTYSGAAYLVHGPVSGSMVLGDAELIYRAVSYDDAAGWSVSGGVDVGTDGVPDILIGATDISTAATYAGGAYLVDGTDTGSHGLDEAQAILVGSQAGSNAGTAVSLIEDFDGDGIGDILVGAPNYDQTMKAGLFTDVGAAFVHFGPLTGTIGLASDADSILMGNQEYDRTGACVAAIPDVTGDGLSDILIGASQADYDSSTGPGLVYLVQGSSSVSGSLQAVSTAVFEGPSGDGHSSFCAASSAGDMDRDGISDILISAYLHDLVAEDAGAGWLYLAPFGGTVTTDMAVASFMGVSTSDEAGYALAAAGDTDADGFPDLLVGAPHSSTSVGAPGTAYLLLGSEYLPPTP